MFSVSDTTLSILKILKANGVVKHLDLYAIVPYAYEHVRMASQKGGMQGLAKTIAKEILFFWKFWGCGFGAKWSCEGEASSAYESVFGP